MQASKAKWTVDSGGAWISFQVPTVQEAREQCDKMIPGKLYDLQIKEYTKKRSLCANALMWKVLGEMAEALAKENPKITPDAIYRQYIRDTGNYYVAEVWDDQLEKFTKSWSAHGIGWFAEATEPAEEADGFTKWTVRMWYGSSQYDSMEMSRLLDAILQDAHAIGLASDNVTALMEAYPDGQ